MVFSLFPASATKSITIYNIYQHCRLIEQQRQQIRITKSDESSEIKQTTGKATFLCHMQIFCSPNNYDICAVGWQKVNSKQSNIVATYNEMRSSGLILILIGIIYALLFGLKSLTIINAHMSVYLLMHLIIYSLIFPSPWETKKNF